MVAFVVSLVLAGALQSCTPDYVWHPPLVTQRR